MDKTIVSNILIVGCGLTGSVAASLIKHETVANVEIWEKDNRIGGRFYTFKNHPDQECIADLGAQYISATLEFIRNHAKFYNELLEKDYLVPLGEKIENFRKLSESKMNFCVTDGTGLLVKHFLKKADVKIMLKHEVTEINLEADSNVWIVKSSNGVEKKFDAVILTIPAPEVLKISGDFQSINPDDDLRMALEQVTYASRYSVALLYNEPQKTLEDLLWSMKFFPDDNIIFFIALDNRKRGKPEELPAIVVQTTSKFYQKHSETAEETVQQIILNHLKCLIGDVPTPSNVKLVKWENSQVIDAYIDNPGCIVLSAHPCLICGGDSFTESNFNGCITSASRIVEDLLKCVNIGKSHRSSKRY